MKLIAYKANGEILTTYEVYNTENTHNHPFQIVDSVTIDTTSINLSELEKLTKEEILKEMAKNNNKVVISELKILAVSDILL